MDIILGSSPEQGGITCYDALLCNVPHCLCRKFQNILRKLYTKKGWAEQMDHLLNSRVNFTDKGRVA